MLTRLLQRKFAIPERLLLDGQNYRELNPDAPVISFTHLEARDPLSALTGSNRLLEGRRVVLLARHPLDVAVSLCHQYRSREWEAKYTALTDASLDEFVRHQVPEIVAFLNRHLRQGSLHAIRLVKYEDLHADPHRALRDLLGFAGLDFSDEEIADAVQFASFRDRKLEQRSFFLGDRLRATDPEDPNSYKVRQGRVGGYREALQPATLAEMERYVAAHLSASFDYTGRAGIIS